MPPKTRNRIRREVVDESNAPPQGTRQRGRDRVQGGRGINVRGRGVCNTLFLYLFILSSLVSFWYILFE